MIRVWDAATGEIVAGPLTGHTDSIYSIACQIDSGFSQPWIIARFGCGIS